MSKQIEVQVLDYSEVTIKRPNGEVETVRTNKFFSGIDAARFNQIKQDTKKAGRGEVLSYKNIYKTNILTMTDADLADQASEKIAKTMAYGE